MKDRARPVAQQRGRAAERFAADLLRREGYRILEANVRFVGGELDLIAEDDGVLVFVEVRARKTSLFGTAEESIGEEKRRRIVLAAETYLQRHVEAAARPSRIDVVAIRLDRSGRPISAELIKNAFGQ